MKFEDFSDVQKKAIKAYGSNVLVSAGAGSGKTEVLSERVLQFVKDGFKMNDFLIMTFTRASAEEMKKRIREKLEGCAETKDESKNVDTADIGTFDSIALNVVKKYHNYFKLESNIKNVDSSFIEVLVRNLFIKKMDEIYVKENSPILDYVEKHCEKDDADFIDFLVKIYQYIENNNIDIDEYKAKLFSAENNNKIKEEATNLFVEIKHKIQAIVANGPTCSIKYNKKDFDYPQSLGETFNGFFNTTEDFYLMAMSLKACKFPSSKKVKDEIDDEYAHDYYIGATKYIESVKEELKQLWDDEKNNIDLFASHKTLIDEILNLVKEVRNEIDAYKRNNAAFEFADISNMALELLRKYPEIRDSYKNRYKMIMIDEYQDTDNKQEEFVSLISNNNVYQVGDIKQSIYRFRNANPKLFSGKFDNYKNNIDGQLVELSSNFRSRPEVIDDVNFIFDYIMTKETGAVDYKGTDGHSHHLDAPNSIYKVKNENQNYNVEFMHIARNSKDDVREDLEIKYILSDIINKVNNGYQVVDKDKTLRACRYSDFAILISTSTSFDAYVESFQKCGVPLSMVKDENITENDFLRVFQNIIKMIGYFRNYNPDFNEEDMHHYVASLARSFLFEMSDDELFVISRDNKWTDNKVYNYFKNLTDIHKDLTLGSLLDLLIKDLNLYQGFIKDGRVARNELYINALIEKVNDMQDLGLSLQEIIDYFDDIEKFDQKVTITNADSEIDSVTLMTIHKSKGLEFKIVYLPEMYRKFQEKDATAKENISVNGISFAQDVKGVSKVDLLYWVHKKQEIKEIIAEKIRVLYVAMTRAREKLIIPWIDEDNSLPKPLVSIDDDYKIKSYNDVLARFIANPRFDIVTTNEVNNESLVVKEVNQKPLIIKDLPIYDFALKQASSHASKELELSTNSDILELGTRLHLAMEVMDLKHPDYSLLNDDKLVTIVKKFIASDICKNIQKGDIYHEYEFVDDTNNKVGIIDMFVVYPDYIDIVDFKTSHIDDSEYDKQLHVYKDFLAQKFNKPINMYLYSLLKGTSRKVD